jgi:purine-binding chemotaxis protein CheW
MPMSSPWLHLAIGAHDLALAVTAVRSVHRAARLTRLPQTDPVLLGVMSLGGEIVPVIDLAARLGLRASRPGRRSSVVVVELPQSEVDDHEPMAWRHRDANRQGPLGLLVDEVFGTVEPPHAPGSAALPLAHPIPPAMIGGAALHQDRLLLLLDLARVLDADSLAGLPPRLPGS